MFHRNRLYLILLFGSVVGCVHEPYNPPLSPAYIQFPIDFDKGLYGSDALVNVWIGNRIYSTQPIRYRELKGDLSLAHDSVPFAYTGLNGWPQVPDSILWAYISLRIRADGNLLLAVRSTQPHRSIGGLDEIDVHTWQRTELIDSSYNVSTAAYVTDDSILYYSLGRYLPLGGSDAGYYIYVKSLRKSEMLLPYVSEIGTLERYNGFDYSHARNTLIFAYTKRGDPLVAEYHLSTGELDTLPISIESGYQSWCLYLRYNHDGTRALFCSYAREATSGPLCESTAQGILDLTTFKKTMLPMSDAPGAPANVCMFPDWSPDETRIVFGGSSIASEPPCALATYKGTIYKLP